MTDPDKALSHLFKQWSGEEVLSLVQLPASGSDRRYFRLSGNEASAIGAYNPNPRENQAFTTFSKHFSDLHLPVPTVYIEDETKNFYLQTDLGDDTLFALLSSEGLSGRVKDLYRQVIHWLPRFQVDGARGLDFSVSYPRHAFDRQSMMWDLNYFKYYFVRLSGLPFDEQALEDDFDALTDYLLQPESGFFLYRDFQSRNVMIAGERTYFIDYQGGRKGPLHYDLASLLYDAKANLPESFREELLERYLAEINTLTSTDHASFREYFYGFVIIRILQALGAYGFRGFYQKKAHFLQSIPYALDNLDYILKHHHPPVEIPALKALLCKMIDNEELRKYAKPSLEVRISSFSYKNAIPTDDSGNGGGFVFDCRALPNPGRLEEYKRLSGEDAEVARYLTAQPETAIFLASIYTLIDQAVENYLARGFQHLMVNFGCTGGQHRSVYCANQLALHLNKRFGINATAKHTQREKWEI